MGPDLTLEVIYFNQSTDFKMEFEISGSCNMRFLSHLTHNKGEFLSALSKSVIRSRVIVAVGSFNPLDSEYLPKIIARATGYILSPINKAQFSVNSSVEYLLPNEAIPLVNGEGQLGGCVMENNDQAIILLTGDREIRHSVLMSLVCPYIKLLSGKQISFATETAIEDSESIEIAENTTVQSQIDTLDELVESSTEQECDQSLVEEKGTEVLDQVNLADTSEPEEEKAVAFGNSTVSAVLADGTGEPEFVVLEQPDSVTPIEYNLEDFLATDGIKTPKKRKKQVLRAVISVILTAAVLVAAYFGYEWNYQPMHYYSVLATAHELYGQTWTGLPENMLYKFGRLYQANNDVIGWLSVPGTEINLPIVSAKSRSSNYYNNHLFEGSVNKYGTPYTNSKITEDTYERNIVIYGNGKDNVSVFSQLKKFLDNEQYRSAPIITFDTLYLENRWKIFSAYSVSNEINSLGVETEFFDDIAFLEYIQKIKNRSIIETNISCLSSDELITLVCKDASSSVVLVARRVREGESPMVDFDSKSDEASSKIPTSSEASSNPLEEISSKITSSKKPDKAEENVADNGSSRYEQEGPVSSAVIIKPTKPITTSKNQTSSKVSSQAVTTSSQENSSEVTTSNTESSSTSSQVIDSSRLPTFSVKNSSTGKVETGKANEIIAYVLEAEMSSSYHLEALKAQAVAAYSWLLCNGAASGNTPTVPMKTPGSRAIQAANEVAGIVATYNGSVAQTYYYAISAGKTANSSDIWSNQLPYLASVDSSVDKNVSGYQTIRKYSAIDVANWAKESLNVDLTKISDKNEWFKCTYDENNLYVRTVSIGGSVQKGPYLRNNFFTSKRVGAANVLRSSAYTISYSASEDKFVFTVKGYGHGVGMSQVGANAYAKSGYTYDQILKHYYKGISLETYTLG